MQSINLCVLTHTKKAMRVTEQSTQGRTTSAPLPPEQSWQRRRGAPSTSLFLLGEQVGEAPTLLILSKE